MAATDTAALQALFDAVPAAGGRVVLRRGTYVLNAALTISHPTTLIGCGKGDMTAAAPTILSVASSTADGLVVAAHGCSFQDFAVINTSGTTPTAGAGIHVTSGDAIAFSRVKVLGFWNNWQIDQARHYTFTDCHGLDAVNYHAYLRNTAVGQYDFGDCTFHGCFFNAYTTTRIAAAAIRWESGGGLKIIGCKTNGNMVTLGQSHTVGISVAVADGVSTSVLQIVGNSLEGIEAGGAPILVTQSGTGSGQLSKVVIVGNETLAGGGIRVVGLTTDKVKGVLIADNVISGATCGIYLKNAWNVTVGKNRHVLPSAASSLVWVDTGCNDYSVAPQDTDTGGTYLLKDDSAQANTHGAVGSTATYSREIPSTTSSVTYTSLYTVQLNAYSATTVRLNLAGQIAGVGAFVVDAARAVIQGNTGTVPTLATIGTDTATTNAPTVSWDVSVNQTLTVKVRLPGSGTDVYGRATILVDGQPSRILRV